MPYFITAYIFLGIVAHLLCVKLLRKRDPKMADDLHFPYRDPLISPLILLWPVYLPAAIFLSFKFPDPEHLRRPPDEIPSTLIGREGVAVGELAPGGRVRIGDELKEALSIDGVIDDGGSILVIEQDALTLKVTRNQRHPAIRPSRR